ncbi:hypothetical protein Scep_009272 [Stephania cephalantha]|uniref:Uncharacterized protein n=1 Tax=Stephania cephalantha TaxID=152367 RepID=A0AAP0JTD4_9MAGN
MTHLPMDYSTNNNFEYKYQSNEQQYQSNESTVQLPSWFTYLKKSQIVLKMSRSRIDMRIRHLTIAS